VAGWAATGQPSAPPPGRPDQEPAPWIGRDRRTSGAFRAATGAPGGRWSRAGGVGFPCLPSRGPDSPRCRGYTPCTILQGSRPGYAKVAGGGPAASDPPRDPGGKAWQRSSSMVHSEPKPLRLPARRSPGPDRLGSWAWPGGPCRGDAAAPRRPTSAPPWTSCPCFSISSGRCRSPASRMGASGGDRRRNRAHGSGGADRPAAPERLRERRQSPRVAVRYAVLCQPLPTELSPRPMILRAEFRDLSVGGAADPPPLPGSDWASRSSWPGGSKNNPSAPGRSRGGRTPSQAGPPQGTASAQPQVGSPTTARPADILHHDLGPAPRRPLPRPRNRGHPGSVG